MKNINKIEFLLDELAVDAIVINQKATKVYVDGLTGSGVWLIISRKGNYQIMDGRYQTAAEESTTVFKNIVTKQGNVLSTILKWLAKENINKIAAEEELPYAQFKALSEVCKVKSLGDRIPKIRSTKTHAEIEKIKVACALGDAVFKQLLTTIHVGMTEKEVVGEIYRLIYQLGADGVSFDPVISSGPRTAMPHGRASDRILCTGDFLLLDFGVVKDGYQSDMTRTISVGKATDQFRKMYGILRPIQNETAQQFIAGKLGKEIHNFAAHKIEVAGYGDYFTHGLGHGLGIGGGERPLMNASSNDVLTAGMVGTCEPGIYIPGLGGIRIEDDILVTNSVPQILTKTTREIIELETND